MLLPCLPRALVLTNRGMWSIMILEAYNHLKEVYFMAIENRAIVIKPSKTREFLEMKPNYSAMKKAKMFMEKHGKQVHFSFDKKFVNVTSDV